MISQIKGTMKTNDMDEVWTRRLFCLIICFAEVQAVFCNTIRMIVPNTFKIDTVIMYIVYIYVFIKALPNIKKHINISDIVAFSILILCVLFSALTPTFEESVIGSIAPSLLLFCIPAYLSAISITNMRELQNNLYIVGYVLLICGTLSMLVFNSYTVSATEHSLLGGYTIAISIILILGLHKSPFDYIAFVFGILLVISAGSRGPFLSIALFFAIYLLIMLPRGAKKIFYVSLIFVALLSMYIFWEDIIKALIKLIDSWGLNNRILTKLINNDVSTDVNRTRLQDFAFEYIGKHPFIGSGILNDRKVIFDNCGFAFYIHNIFLELMIQFGAVIGGAISLCIIATSIKTFLFAKVRDTKVLFLITMGCGLFPLFVSFSYITYTYFYLFIGMLVNNARNGIVKSETY